MTTLQELRDIGYALLREEEDTTAYPLVLMDMMLNSSQNRICKGTVINPMNGQAVRKGKLSFLDASAFYSNIGLTTLSADAVVGAVTLDITDTTNYPNAGSIYIDGNFITYIGKSATQFTGVTGIDFAHLAGSTVSIAFVLPDNFSSSINVTYANKFKLSAKNYDDIWEDLNSVKGYHRNDGYTNQNNVPPFYSIVGDYLVVFNRNNTGDQVHLRYEIKPPTMTTSVDATIPDDFAPSTIPYLALGELLYNRGEESRGAELINFGLGQVREMYSYYNDRSLESINGVQYRMGKNNLNI